MKTISVFVLMFFLIQYGSCTCDDREGENPQTPQAAPGRYVTEPWFGYSENTEHAIHATLHYGVLASIAKNSYDELPLTHSLGAAVVGYFSADFLSGFIHMIIDNLDPEKVPLWLKTICNDFHAHHKKPLGAVYDSFWYQNREMYLVGDAFLVGSVALGLMGYDLSALTFAVTGALTSVTNWTHACAHGRLKGNKIITLLQRCGLLLDKESHRIHHAKLDRNFCGLNGSMNFVVNRIFWTSQSVVRWWKKDSSKEINNG